MAISLRRSKDDSFVNSVVSCTETRLDHLLIIPYVPHFVLKYNAQNNMRSSLTVWICLLFTQIRVQELCLRETQVRAPDSVGTVQTKWNEAQNMLDSKFVSGSVAGWRFWTVYAKFMVKPIRWFALRFICHSGEEIFPVDGEVCATEEPAKSAWFKLRTFKLLGNSNLHILEYVLIVRSEQILQVLAACSKWR